MSSEPLTGSAPHFLGQDVAGAFFDVIAEAVSASSLLVRPGDDLYNLTHFLNRAAAVPKEAKKGLKFEFVKNTDEALKIAPNIDWTSS